MFGEGHRGLMAFLLLWAPYGRDLGLGGEGQ